MNPAGGRRGGFLLLVVATTALVTGACNGGRVEEIGGGFSIQAVPTLPESGLKPRSLMRTTGNRRIVVDEFIEKVQYYEPDCVVYQTARRAHDVFAVCGDRTPIAIATSAGLSWRFDADGLRRVPEPVLKGGRLVSEVEFLEIERLRSLAIRQPRFDAGWRSASSFDPNAPPLEAARADRPVELETRDRWGNGPLFDAVRLSRIDVVEALLRSGADVNAANTLGSTPLMVASGKGDLEIVERLLAAGANVDVADRDGRTALMSAADVGETRVVKRLLAAGADATLRDAKNRTAIERIPSSQDAELLELLRNASGPKTPVTSSR